MPVKAKRPCSCPSCPACLGRCAELVTSGRCPTCATDKRRNEQRNEQRSPESAERGKLYTNSKRWQGVRRTILQQEPWCRTCKTALATNIDHITPRDQGGDTWSYANLQPLCHSCHSRKTARERTQRR